MKEDFSVSIASGVLASLDNTLCSGLKKNA
jgi:hypothetical protein